MARKFELITQLYYRTLQEVAHPSHWQSFLASVCHNYRLPFDEQVLLFAQRPDATAVLEIDRWNRRFGRWVNRGAIGIAVFDRDAPNRSRLKYYFDLADTHPGRFARPVPVWEVEIQHQDAIVEALESSFGTLEDTSSFAAALRCAARNAVEDNVADYLPQLHYYREGSYLEELDENSVETMYRRLLTNSVGLLMMARCGVYPGDYYAQEDFQEIVNFNTADTINALGTATGDIAQMCLSEIARTVLDLQRHPQRQNRTVAETEKEDYAVQEQTSQPNTERSADHEPDHLSEPGGLPPAQPPASPGAGDNPWEIRIPAPAVSPAAPADRVHQPADLREADGASRPDRPDGEGAGGADHPPDGAGAGRDRADEGTGSDEVGGDDEQHPSGGGGDRAAGTDLRTYEQITEEAPEENAGGSSLPAFLDERLMESILTNPEDNLKYRKSQIQLYFSVHTDSEERADYLRSAYPEEAVERVIGNDRVGYQKQENGLLMWEGFYPSRTSESVFSWAAVAEIVGQLIRDEKYHLNTDAKPLTTPEMQQVTLFEAEEPKSAAEQEQIPIFGNSIQYPQQVVDEALCMGANDEHSRMMICAYFQKDKPDNAAFLRDHYGENGAGFFLNGRQYAIWYNAEGFRISAGDSVKNGVSMLLTWEDAAKRIRELLELGRYLPREELEQAADFERKTLAQGLWYLRQDFSETAREAGYLPTVSSVYGGQGGFPAQSESIELLLQHPGSLQSILDEMAQFAEACREEPSLLRFRYHRPDELLQSLSNLQREPLSFPAGEDRAPINAAISMDEMDNLLRGAERRRDYRLGVYSFFTQHRDAKEREQYMKRLHGEYSGYHGGNDNIEYTTKGLMFSHGSITQPYARVQWNWAKAVKRIDLLIRQGRFLSEGDREELEQREPPEEETEPETPEPEEPTNEPQEIEIEPPEQTDEPQAEDTQTATPVLSPPPRLRRQSVRFAPFHPEIPPEQRHNFRITDRELGNGTPAEKYKANVEAIRTLQKIEGEKRLATRSEQEVLSRYVGWGGLADCFDERNSHYGELKSLLDEQEYAAARESTLTAFYTAPVIIEAIYKALSQMGFTSGNLLEPSCGVGNFIGMLPESMADSKVYGVELDSISGRIAQQLYQNSSIAVSGFERVEMPDSFFDVALGNVPFGDFKVLDRRYEKHHWLIHDYFFGKTLDKVRPGGVVAFITSKGTLDKENSAVRRYLAQRADLIGAIRLPDNAFKRNAGTEVTSDIIFLQKRDRITDIQPDWVGLDTDENGIRMNRYFVQHPEMILGNMVMESTRFGMDTACKAYEDADLSELLSEAVSNLHAEITAYEVEELDEEEDRSIPADPTVRNFSFTTVDGTIYFRENARMRPVEASVTAQNRIRGMIALRDCVRQVIELQTEDAPDEAIRREQARLNTLYDDYTGKYGLLSSRGNNLAFSDDSSYSLLCSLEVLDEEGHFQRKADLFTKRTIRPHIPVTSVDTASEALAVSISEKAGVDMAYMSQLSGKTEAELEQELSGVIFRDIHCEEQPELIPEAYRDLSRFPFVTADAFLSGNVRRKLRMVRAMAEAFPELSDTLQVSIRALEGVQPVDLTAGEIGVRIGVNWVPSEIYEQFMYELFGTGYYAKTRIHILRSSATGEWNITNKTHDSSNVRTFTTYGTKRVNAYQILELTLNQKDVRVFDTKIEPDGKETRVLNKRETAIAQDRQEIIKAKFAEWLWKDIDRRERLCRVYNETFNSIRPREYEGRHITFPGMNPEIQLRPHQINAIAHVMYGGNTLLAHEVGAGKTFEMVAAAMESKRLGLCTKSLVVVPNHITEQWAAEWLQLYPSANILVATKRDFERKNRRRFCARIATGDYDAIIIGHSQFEKIPMSKERQEQIIQRQIDEIMDGIEQAQKARAERYTIKQLEKTRKSLQQRLDKLNDQSRKDDVVTFEELGVDRLFVDESHYFKNMFLATKMRNVGGIAQTEAQKSSDLFMKCQYLDELTGGRGVVFATGTPISNSMVELYTIQRYLQYRTLEEMDMLHFDDWAAAFGETISAIELSPEGSGYRAKTRFAKFYNLPELMSIFKQCADIQTADMLKLPVPKVNFHTEVIKPSEMQREMVDSLAERAERIRAGGVDPKVDNMLRITNDGRKLALDMRLVQPLAPDDENGKISRCARNIFRIWEETKAQRGAQLFFCDLSTPRHDGTFNVYDDLKQKLMGMGIPEEEIAYIHDANTEVRKQELFAKVRSGQVRVLMGSTAKMGAGTNVQDRLVALHDADCPWRPSDLAQRLGRIVRQGNKNAEVDVFRYVTENTFDAYLFQLVENKQRFIAQIMTSKSPVRVADDIDETALSYSEIKALATGNPLIIEKCNLDMEVGKLNVLKASHMSQKYALEELVYRRYPEDIKGMQERVKGYEQDIQTAEQHPKPEEGYVGIEIQGQRYTEKEAAGHTVLDICTHMTEPKVTDIGCYRGFGMDVEFDARSNNYYLDLKGALSHQVTLGVDVLGNLTRIDNAVEGLADKLEHLKGSLTETEKQLANAREEMNAPFAKEEELAEKTARLKELNILLNMDEHDRTLMDDVPEEEKPGRCRERER